jgi:Ca2+/Na+ antiporter
MIALAGFLWGWLLAAFVLGLGMGWIAVVHRGRMLSGEMMRRILVVLVVVVGVALARAIPGRAGYWLDLGLVMFALYVAGCAIGSALRDRVVSRHAAR